MSQEFSEALFLQQLLNRYPTRDISEIRAVVKEVPEVRDLGLQQALVTICGNSVRGWEDLSIVLEIEDLRIDIAKKHIYDGSNKKTSDLMVNIEKGTFSLLEACVNGPTNRLRGMEFIKRGGGLINQLTRQIVHTHKYLLDCGDFDFHQGRRVANSMLDLYQPNSVSQTLEAARSLRDNYGYTELITMLRCNDIVIDPKLRFVLGMDVANNGYLQTHDPIFASNLMSLVYPGEFPPNDQGFDSAIGDMYIRREGVNAMVESVIMQGAKDPIDIRLIAKARFLDMDQEGISLFGQDLAEYALNRVARAARRVDRDQNILYLHQELASIWPGYLQAIEDSTGRTAEFVYSAQCDSRAD